MQLDISRICVPTDFSEAADHAVHYAASLAKLFQADLHLLHVLEHTGQLAIHPDFTHAGEITRDYFKQLEATAEANDEGDSEAGTDAVKDAPGGLRSKAGQFTALLQSMHADAVEQIGTVGKHWWSDLEVHRDIRSGHPVREINHYVEAREIDLVVIGSQGHSKLATMLLGSVTERVVQTCGCPVLVVRYPEHRYSLVKGE